MIDEILLSSDKTIAVIDGSGVLADPVGINREELVRLAKLRMPVAFFDKSKLSHDGYLVKIEEQDVKLPCECFLLLLLLSGSSDDRVSGRGCTGWYGFPKWSSFEVQGRFVCSVRWAVSGCVFLLNTPLTGSSLVQSGSGEYFEYGCPN